MDISDILFLCIQHGSHNFPVPGLYISAGDSRNRAGRDRVYVAADSHEAFGVDFTWSLLGYNVLYDASGAVVIGGGSDTLSAMKWDRSLRNASISRFRETLRLRATEIRYIRRCGTLSHG